jgi:hypothetical protein
MGRSPHACSHLCGEPGRIMSRIVNRLLKNAINAASHFQLRNLSLRENQA